MKLEFKFNLIVKVCTDIAASNMRGADCLKLATVKVGALPG